MKYKLHYKRFTTGNRYFLNELRTGVEFDVIGACECDNVAILRRRHNNMCTYWFYGDISLVGGRPVDR